ncbi:hypothetical protein, partial [Myxococcus xanthus]
MHDEALLPGREPTAVVARAKVRGKVGQGLGGAGGRSRTSGHGAHKTHVSREGRRQALGGWKMSVPTPESVGSTTREGMGSG